MSAYTYTRMYTYVCIYIYRSPSAARVLVRCLQEQTLSHRVRSMSGPSLCIHCPFAPVCMCGHSSHTSNLLASISTVSPDLLTSPCPIPHTLFHYRHKLAWITFYGPQRPCHSGKFVYSRSLCVVSLTFSFFHPMPLALSFHANTPFSSGRVSRSRAAP